MRWSHPLTFRSIAPEVDIFDHPIQLLMSTIDLASGYAL